MADSISWVATIATIIAASMTAANLGSRITGYGFAVFLVGSLCWLATGILTDQPALVWTNVVLTILNIFGMWRWLGRQAQVEEGARAAAEASEDDAGRGAVPGFAALARGRWNAAKSRSATVRRDGRLPQRQLDYVVVSEGGSAGSARLFGDLPWRDARSKARAVIADFARE